MQKSDNMSSEQNYTLKDSTRIKLMEAFAQLDGGLAQLERRIDYLEKTIANVDQRTTALQIKIQERALTGSIGAKQ